MKKQYTEILNLPGVIVKSKKEIEQSLILEVECQSKTAICPHCQQSSHRLHQNHCHLIKDLPWGEKEVFLKINRRQFKCGHCQKIFSEDLSFVGKRKKYTDRYAKSITEQVLNSNLLNVAKKNNLTESEVEAMINQISQKVLPINLKEVTRVGIDEISLVKGQGKFIVVLVDLDTGQLIALIKERKSETIEAFLKSWSQEILEQIKEVSMDLLKMYKTVFNKLCPNAVITADRFHVSKLLHQELNQGRIDQKKTANDLAIKAREKIFSTLKGGKYVLLKREKELKEKSKDKLAQIKQASPLLGVMHTLKEEFTEIFENSQNLGEGTIQLTEWLIKAEIFFPKTVKTIKNWFTEIVGYFEQKTTNGLVEGINNRLKVIKRCAFGFRSFDNFQKRALLFWHIPDSLA
ncbi:MAG: ISL3 family transposase [Symploca sp. SIO1B1]|nr:ISL3 family transposase [Symploca sp. SIO1B1]